MKPFRLADSGAQALLLLGATHYVLQGLRHTRNERKPLNANAAKLYFGLLSAATLYGAGRLVGPKTQEEKRLARLASLYGQADSYRRRAQLYTRSAEALFKRGLHTIKTAVPK